MNQSILKIVLSALLCALIVVGAQLAIPFWPVPLVLANFFALLAGMLLGPVWGGISVVVYLALGALGLGVFANGSGGIAIFAGPTGGFLFGYLLSAIVGGIVSDRKHAGIVRLSLAALLGVVSQYVIGLPWLQIVVSGNSVAAGKDVPAGYADLFAALLTMSPYLLGDLVKLIVAILICRAILPVIGRYTGVWQGYRSSGAKS